ncbi:hypothetical protein LJC59_08710 [Desulfovibrio sp. OttesenSCG-928-A18]|nr:hypothetical protein [Desulfovibrio sp. OttesenSCG-928-A18]
MSLRSRTLFLLSLLLLATALYAQRTDAAPAAPADKVDAQRQGEAARPDPSDPATALAMKAAMKADATPISVEHNGTDTLGAKLALTLKEQFNAGTLFVLRDSDSPRLQLLVHTAAEFPSRPGVGSVYSIVWVYSEKPTVLSSYLAQETGVITPEGLADLADRLTARTAGLAARHSYVFGK